MKPVITHLNAEDFDAYLANAEGPVLVDFWADWCGPCRTMNPVLEELAADTAERANIAKVNVESAPALAQRFGVQAIPTFLVFREGELTAQARGIKSKHDLAALLA